MKLLEKNIYRESKTIKKFTFKPRYLFYRMIIH